MYLLLRLAPTYILSIVLLLQLACSTQEPQNSLRIGLLPHEDHSTMKKKYTPLFKYISTKTGMDYEIVVASSYQDLLERFNSKQMDLALFGGVTFIKAQKQSKAIPIASRDIDLEFNCYFLVKTDSPFQELEQLRGKSIAFGNRLSTSGHLMPRHFMKKQNIEPESFFSKIIYSGSHDRTAYLVRDGQADLGVANALVVDNMLKDKRITNDELRILWKTPNFPDHVWAAQADMDQELVEKIKAAFLLLDFTKESESLILSKLGARAFYPVSSSDFNSLSEIMHSLNL